MEEIKSLFCPRCRSTLQVKNFYKSNNYEKFKATGGFYPLCKKCATLGLDVWDPKTFAYTKPDGEPSLLEELDVPWIPDEWYPLLSKYGNDPKVSPTALFGRYLSKMRINQYKNFRFNDTEKIQEIKDAKVRETMFRQGFSAAEVEQAILEGRMKPPEKKFEEAKEAIQIAQAKELEPENTYGLTDEDKMYLSNKWGSTYKEDEWIELERFYLDMTDAFNIQTPSHKDTLKHICKVSLRMNTLLDMGDVDGYQKLSKAYDGLMKSGNFTAAQNKADTAGYLDSVSELVAICEKEGFIPRYYIEQPNDKADRVLQDLQLYNRKLIMDETNLGNMIESAIKQIQEDNEKASIVTVDDTEEDIDAIENQLFGSQGNVEELSDEDMIEFKEWEEKEGADFGS